MLLQHSSSHEESPDATSATFPEGSEKQEHRFETGPVFYRVVIKRDTKKNTLVENEKEILIWGEEARELFANHGRETVVKRLRRADRIGIMSD